MRSGMKRFFGLCAVVFVIGLVLAAVGYAAGGVEDSSKLADKWSWFSINRGERVLTEQEPGAFQSVKVSGTGDVQLVGPEYWSDLEKLQRVTGLKAEDDVDPEAYKVYVIRAEKMEEPEMEVRDGTLHITLPDDGMDGLNLDLNAQIWCSEVIVCCPEETMKSISVSSNAGDMDIYGISADQIDQKLLAGDVTIANASSGNIKLELAAGDAELKKVTAGGLDLKLMSGDAEISGSFQGKTLIKNLAGDTEFDTELAKEKYSIDIQLSAGDLTVAASGKKPLEMEGHAEFQDGNGPESLNIEAAAGDVDVTFGNH